MDRVTILDVNVDNLSLQEVLEKTNAFLDTQDKEAKHYIVTTNPEFIVKAQKDKLFKDILNYADISVADGAGLQYAARFQGKSLARVPGVDLFWQMCEQAQERGDSIYLLGAGPGIAEQATKIISEHFPNITIAGYHEGGEMHEDYMVVNQDLVNRINAKQPVVLFVALGHGKQEKWIFKHLDHLDTVKVAMGVGGSFDYITDNIVRAPEIMRRMGLEWLYRLIQEPWRWKRIANAVVVFPILVVIGKFKPLK